MFTDLAEQAVYVLIALHHVPDGRAARSCMRVCPDCPALRVSKESGLFVRNCELNENFTFT